MRLQRKYRKYPKKVYRENIQTKYTKKIQRKHPKKVYRVESIERKTIQYTGESKESIQRKYPKEVHKRSIPLKIY